MGVLTILTMTVVLAGAAIEESAETPNAPYEALAAAYDALDPEMAADAYAPDAVYAPPSGSAFLAGHEIETAFGFLAAAAEQDARLHLSFRVIRRTVSSQSGGDAGYYRLIWVSADGEERVSYGKFLTLLSHDPLEGWRFLADGFTGADAAAWDAALAQCVDGAPCAL